MSNPAKALFSILLVVISIVFIVYCSDRFVIDTHKDTYEDALQSVTQAATLSMIDTKNINNLYDGGRRESSDIPIDYTSLDYFRENIDQQLATNKAGVLGKVSNINIPLVGYISYDYIFGVTYGESYNSAIALANQGTTATDYFSQDINSRNNKNRHGTYLLPMGYVHYATGSDASLAELNNSIFRFTLGDTIFVNKGTMNEITDASGKKSIEKNETAYIIYNSGCSVCDAAYSDTSNGCYLHKINPTDNKLWHNNGELIPGTTNTDIMPDIINIEDYIKSLKFDSISQLRDYIVMSTINNYLTQYSSRGFSNTADNIATSLNISLNLSDYSSGKGEYTRGSTVIDGPGMFAIIDLFEGSKDEEHSVQRLASFGSSELARTTLSSNKGLSQGTIGGDPSGPGGSGGTPGGPGGPSGPSGPGGSTEKTITITYNPNGGNGSTKQEQITFTGNSTQVVLAKNSFTAQTGKKFKCWGTIADGTGTNYYTNSTMVISEDITLYAIWEDNLDEMYLIKYYDGDNLIGEHRVVMGAKTTIISLADNNGLKLYGWSIAKESNTIYYTPGEEVIPSSDITMYAVWDNAEKLIVSASGGIYTYDGKKHTVAVTSNDDNTSYSIIYKDKDNKEINAPVNAGTYNVSIEATSGIRKAFAETTITIEKRNLYITTPDAIKVYDGEPLTAKTEAILEGVVDGDDIILNVTGSRTSIGSSPNTYELIWDSSVNQDNYIIKNENVSIGTLTVTDKSMIELTIDLVINGITEEQLPNYSIQYYSHWENEETGDEDIGDPITLSLAESVDRYIEDDSLHLIWKDNIEEKDGMSVSAVVSVLNANVDGYELDSDGTMVAYCDITGGYCTIHMYYTVKHQDIIGNVQIIPVSYTHGSNEIGEKLSAYICLDNLTTSPIHAVINLDGIINNESVANVKAYSTYKNSEGTVVEENLGISLGNDIDIDIPGKISGNSYESIVRIDFNSNTINSFNIQFSVLISGERYISPLIKFN